MKDSRLLWFKHRVHNRMSALLTVTFLLEQLAFASLHHSLNDNHSGFLHYAEIDGFPELLQRIAHALSFNFGTCKNVRKAT